MTGIAHDKKAMRKALALARDALPPETRRQAALRLAATGCAGLQTGQALSGMVVAGFMPFRSEIDPQPLMAALFAAGVRLALPRMEGGGLVFHTHAAGDALLAGPYGILEPAAETAQVRPDLILAPLVAFDRAGGRLGYGKGFYDRAFADHPAARRIGLAYAMQEVPCVPREAHDVPLHLVLTEGEAIVM